jgi:hypothetical protein
MAHYSRMRPLDQHFAPFRTNTIGHDLTFRTPYGEQRLVYADWTASGRLYRPIEATLAERFGAVRGEHAQRVVGDGVDDDDRVPRGARADPAARETRARTTSCSRPARG